VSSDGLVQQSRIVELSYEALKHEYIVYVDDVLKAVGFLLVALGWLLTSETARKTLQARNVNSIVLCCVAAVGVNVGGLLAGHYLRSQRIQESLNRLAPEMHDLVVNYAISPEHVLLNAIVLYVLIFLLFLIVWRLRGGAVISGAVKG
jgi:uncharacterized membrane protein